jgi:hypothetical protein
MPKRPTVTVHNNARPSVAMFKPSHRMVQRQQKVRGIGTRRIQVQRPIHRATRRTIAARHARIKRR